MLGFRGARQRALATACALLPAVLGTACGHASPYGPALGVPMPTPMTYRLLDLGAPIADDAFPGGNCGYLRASWRPDFMARLLDGHLRLHLPAVHEKDPPQYIETEQTVAMRKRSTFEYRSSEFIFRIVAEELYRRAPRDFAAAVERLEAGTEGPHGRMDLHLPAIGYVPRNETRATGATELSDVLRVYVVTPDDMVERLSFSVSPELAENEDGCAGLARDVALTLEPGPRAPDLRAAVLTFPGGIHITVPEGVAMSTSLPNVDGSELHRVTELGRPSGDLRYLFAIQRFADEGLGRRWYGSPLEPWYDDETPKGRYRRRAMWHLVRGGRQDLESPGQGVIIEADDRESLDLLTRVAESAWTERLHHIDPAGHP